MSTAAERQRRFRAKRKQTGLIRVEVWVDRYQAHYINEIAAGNKDVFYFPKARRQPTVTGHTSPAPEENPS
ncbi:MAG: hypothetical protein V2J55_07295 [Candidatus Competibacteraceae bacterium]|jgi:hypothetical protein|nr:hypothetical protein [Candidatus Competibacteraceae bacterium]